MELVKHANSVNFYSNIELPKKYRPELEVANYSSAQNRSALKLKSLFRKIQTKAIPNALGFWAV